MSHYLRKWTHKGARRQAWAVHVVEGQVEVRKACPKGGDKSDARDYEDKVRKAIRAGDWCVPCVEFKAGCKCAVAPVAEDLSLEQFAIVWQARNTREISRNTVGFYGECLKVINKQMGALPIRSVGFEHIEAFKAHLHAADYAPNTINNFLATLSALLGFAAKAGKFGVGNRGPIVALLSKTKQPGKYLTGEQEAALLRWVKAHAPEWHAVFVVLLETGLRIGELIALEWRNVDLKGGTLHVTRMYYRGEFEDIALEDEARRVVPLSPVCAATLKALPRTLKNPFVFPGSKHAHMTEASPRDVFANATEYMKESAGAGEASGHEGLEPYTRADNITPHVLRHTFATRLVSEGVSLDVIGKLMGHADSATTRVYAKVTDEALRAAVGQKRESK